MDKMREEFEEWLHNEKIVWATTERTNKFSASDSRLFSAWQASRAALVVELPSHVNDMDSAPMLYDSIVEQLNALGVRYE